MAVSTPPHPPGRTLALGDAACILLFAILGLQTHNESVSLSGVLRNAPPILLVWWLLAPFLRTYTRPSWANLLVSWFLAVSMGVWLRAMVLQRPLDAGYLVFWMVALGTTLALLLAWRGLAWLFLRPKQP